MTRINAAVLGNVVDDVLGRDVPPTGTSPVRAHGGPEALWQLPAAREAASCDALKGGIHGRGAGAAYGAKEPALGDHGRRHGALALKVLLEA